MRIFSWSSLLFVLSLSFVWGGGYWLWLQTASWQQQQHKADLSLQVERASNALSEWQQNYRLHLQYLQHDLDVVTPLNTESPLLDPWQEVSDKIQHTLWPDPLLAYAWLDQDGRALRFSQHEASDWLAQQQRPEQEPGKDLAQFGTPLVYQHQWLIPVYLPFRQGHVVLWVSLQPLQQQLQQLVQKTNGTSWLLVGVDGELQSPSPFQTSLMAKLNDNATPSDKPLRFSLKRPPVDLQQARQTFDSTTAWPETALMTAMRNSSRGFLPGYQINYLGRPALSAWQWHKDWQAYLVVERDGVLLLKEQHKRQQWLLMALGASSVVLTFIFILLQLSMRKQARRHEAELAEQSFAAVEPSDLSEALEHAETAHLTRVPELSQAQTLLQAWLRPNVRQDELRQLTQAWIARHPANQGPQPLYAIALATPIYQVVNRVQQRYPEAELMLAMAPDLPEWMLLPWAVLPDTLEFLLADALQRSATQRVRLNVQMAEQQVIRFDIDDDGQRLSDGQWLAMLHPAASEHSEQSICYRQIQSWVSSMRGQLSAQTGNENRLQLSIPAQPLQPAVAHPELLLVDGSAMLLCPAGPAQQHYSRLLRQTGLLLMPLDDPQQFVQWCAAQQQQSLDYLLLDEAFVRHDQALASQMFAIVRRYFPDATLVLFAADAKQWSALVETLQLHIVEKPVLPVVLQQALQSTTAGIFAPTSKGVWLYEPDSLQYWYQEQQLITQGFSVMPVTTWPQLPDCSADELLLLPLTERVMLSDCVDELKVVWTCTESVLVDTSLPSMHVWPVDLGGAELSHVIYQALQRNS